MATRRHAHARGRHIGYAPAASGFYIGDQVQTVAEYPGLWAQGWKGKILSLGACKNDRNDYDAPPRARGQVRHVGTNHLCLCE